MEFYWKYRRLQPGSTPNVLFLSLPEDHNKNFERISDLLLGTIDCAICYINPDTKEINIEEIKSKLEQMRLLIVPITLSLLTTENEIADQIIPYALKMHIPFLPLMQERGLTGLFTSKFGKIHFLYDSDIEQNEKEFEKKLKSNLFNILPDQTLYNEISAEFSPNIFLSYRHADKDYVRKLIKVIHNVPGYSDAAIWYDSYLIAGDDYNNIILNKINECDIFVLLVTPNLIKENNLNLTVKTTR